MEEINVNFRIEKNEPLIADFKTFNKSSITEIDYEVMQNKPSINDVELVGNKTADELGLALASDIPTLTSQLQNDSNYATQLDIMQAIATIPQFKLSIVSELPTTGEKMTLYLVPKDGTNNDVYDEYIWIENTASFEHLGTTAVDLTEYAKLTDLSNLATKAETEALLDKKQDVLTPNAPIELSKVVLSASYGYLYNDDGTMQPNATARWYVKSVSGQQTLTTTLPYNVYIDSPLNLDNANNKFVMYPELMTTYGAESNLYQALGKLDADGNFYPIIILNPVGDASNANSSRYWLASSLATNNIPVTITTQKGTSATSATSSYLATGDSLNPYVVAFGFQKTSASQINISSVRTSYNWTVTVNSSLINEINCFRVLHRKSGTSGIVKPQFIGLFQGSSTVATDGTTLRQDVKKALDGELTSEIDIVSTTTIHQVKLQHDDTLKIVDGKLTTSTKILVTTQSDYDALATKEANTLYLIEE